MQLRQTEGTGRLHPHIFVICTGVPVDPPRLQCRPNVLQPQELLNENQKRSPVALIHIHFSKALERSTTCSLTLHCSLSSLFLVFSRRQLRQVSNGFGFKYENGLKIDDLSTESSSHSDGLACRTRCAHQWKQAEGLSEGRNFGRSIYVV